MSQDLQIHPSMEYVYDYIATLHPEDMLHLELLADKLNEKAHEFDEICSFRERSVQEEKS